MAGSGPGRRAGRLTEQELRLHVVRARSPETETA
jgi:hypothetical protein